MTTPPLPVAPTRDDPIVGAGSEIVGGVAGRRIRPYASWWTPLRVCLAFAILAMCMAFFAKAPCREDGWTEGDQYRHACYSDVPILFSVRGLADGGFPYLDQTAPPFEYPVVTGIVAGVSAVVINTLPIDEGIRETQRYFDLNVVLLTGCLLLTVGLTATMAGRRPWDAAMLALAPGIVLAGTVNWDLWAVALTAAAMWAWARRQPVTAGIFLGLAVAAKLYPLFLLGPLLILCLRAGRMSDWLRLTATTALAWFAVNLPFMLAAPDAWATFYRFSSERGIGFGSPWYALERHGIGVPADLLNVAGSMAFLLLCLGIAALVWWAPRRPRVPQVAFLVVAAFLLTNKVYSPQYVVWLVPLFVLARPRWRDFLIWQSAEVLYFLAVWWHIEGLQNPDLRIPDWPHSWATVLRMAAQLFICALIVRDVLDPTHDPVRADGVDDPAGGVLDGAPDAYRSRSTTSGA